MAIPVIETYYEWISTAAVSAIPLDKPSGVVTGDLLLLIVGNEDSTTTPQFVDDVTGFDLQFEIGDGVSDNHLAVYSRISQGDEASSLTVNTESSDYCYGWYVRISGAHPTLFWNFNTTGQMTAAAPIDVTGATPDKDDVLAFVFAGLDGADGGVGTIAGTGWSKWRSLETTAGGSSGASGVVGTKDIASQTATGTATADWSVSDGTAGIQFGIAPVDTIPTVSDISPDEFDDDETGIVITGINFNATQGAGKVELCDNAVYASANKQVQTITAWADTEITFTCDFGSIGPGSWWIFVSNSNPETQATGYPVTVHRAHEFVMSGSTYIPASGANTTAQLTAPASGSFGGGRIQDDENPTDAVDLALNEYREDEWALEARSTAAEVQYQFRVTLAGVPIDTYTVDPRWTISGFTVHDLTIQEASHGHTADNIVLGYLNILSINECAHFHAADPCNVSILYDLAINDCLHSHHADHWGTIGEESGDLFNSGFETAGLADWDSVNQEGSTIVQRSVAAKKDGAYGLEVIGDGASDEAYVEVTSYTEQGQDLYCRFNLYVPTATIGASKYHLILDTVDDTNRKYGIAVQTNASTELGISYGHLTEGMIKTVTYGELEFDTWYVVEIYMKRHATTGGGEIWVDGGSLGSDFTMDTSAGDGIDTVWFGSTIGSNPLPDGESLYFDNFALGSTYLGVPSVDPYWWVLYNLSVDDCLHTHTADEPVLSSITTLEIQECLHDHLADPCNVAVSYQLVIQECLHDHAADEPVLTSVVNLTVQDCLHTHTAEEPDVTADFYLVIQDCLHDHLAESPVPWINTDLTVEDSHHTHTADPCDVAVSYLLDINDCLHAHAVDNIVLTYISIIPSIDDCLHSHTADEPVLTAIANLDINEATHQHFADPCNVVISYLLDIDECLHDLTSDNLTLTTNLALEIQSCLHGHQADEPDISVDFYLVIADCLHGHTADPCNPQLLTTLSIDDCLHDHSVENLDLVNLYILSVDECLHGHQADNLDLVNVYQLAIAESLHDHLADNIVLQSLVTLDPADCWHNQLADQCDVELVSGVIDLEIQDAHHAHAADTCEPTNVYILSIDECFHAQAAEEPSIVHDAATAIYPTFHSDASGMNRLYETALLDLSRLFQAEPRTDLWENPGLFASAIHHPDCFIRMEVTTVTTTIPMNIYVRQSGFNELTLKIWANGQIDLLENAVTRITGSPGDVTDGDIVTLILDDAHAWLLVENTLIGAYHSLGLIAGSQAKVVDLGDGALGTVEFLLRDYPMLPKEL